MCHFLHCHCCVLDLGGCIAFAALFSIATIGMKSQTHLEHLNVPQLVVVIAIIYRANQHFIGCHGTMPVIIASF